MLQGAPELRAPAAVSDRHVRQVAPLSVGPVQLTMPPSEGEQVSATQPANALYDVRAAAVPSCWQVPWQAKFSPQP